ncbi:MAG: RnfABCDGE type electron transport complex subunit B [Casimicrobiaceae bacterium]
MHSSTALAGRIDDLLPQTQCTRCGYPGCRPYADAIALGEADINRCPPGGESVLASLASLLGRAAPALDASRGAPGPLRIARIDEAACIGCTLCIQACPVDAIIGAQKRLHGVLSSLCSGCELCIPPCPVDCIAMEPAGRSWEVADAHAARARYEARRVRIASRRDAASRSADERKRKAAVDAALARARARRAAVADS